MRSGSRRSMVREELTRKIIRGSRQHLGASGYGRRQMTRRSVILGTGSALPPRRVTNARAGRDGSRPPTNGSSSAPASRRATSPATARPRRRSPPRRRERRSPRRASPAEKVGLIVLATATPDQTFPASATRVQTALGINDCIAFDVAAVCSGFLYALSVADNMLSGGMADNALVIGAETFSRILDWEDRATCVLFGDGAGAIVLRAEDAEDERACSPPASMPTAATTICSMSTAASRRPARSASCA